MNIKGRKWPLPADASTGNQNFFGHQPKPLTVRRSIRLSLFVAAWCQQKSAASARFLAIDRIEEAALFELIDQRQIDKLLGLRHWLLVRELIFDHELDGFQRRPRSFL